MSESPANKRLFQLRLSTLLVLVAALSAVFALNKAGFAELALFVGLPFTAGVLVGEFTPRNWSLLVAPLGAIIALPIYGAIFSFFEPTGYESTMLTGALGTLILVPGMILFGSIPAVAGAAVSRQLNRSSPENPIPD